MVVFPASVAPTKAISCHEPQMPQLHRWTCICGTRTALAGSSLSEPCTFNTLYALLVQNLWTNLFSGYILVKIMGTEGVCGDKKETVCEDTLYILREYYHLNTEPLFLSLPMTACGSVLETSWYRAQRRLRRSSKTGSLCRPLSWRNRLSVKSKLAAAGSLWCWENIPCTLRSRLKSSAL